MELLANILIFDLPFSASSVENGIKSDPKLIAIWCLIFGFIIATIIILMQAVFSRKRKNRNDQKTSELNKKFHDFLSELASGNYENKVLELMAADRNTTLALSKEDISKPFNRTTLLKELLSLHQDIAGESAHKLRETYLTLGFKEESLSKLKKRSWVKRVEGIQELSKMDIKDGYHDLFKLVNDKHPLVRLEAILSRIKLDREPLSFLLELKKDLTDWEQLRIHGMFRKFHMEDVPSFIPFIYHPLDSVQLFAIKMCALFNQVAAEKELLSLLGSHDCLLNRTILQSLRTLGSELSVQKVHEQFSRSDEAIKIEIIHTLEGISGEDALGFFADQLNPETYDVQLEAAKALANLGEKGKKRLDEELDTLTVEVQQIIKHAKEWHNS